jgi:hypothetical protein
MRMKTVPVYEWVAKDGTVLGCGTRVELDHWEDEGVFTAHLGKVLCHEPASEDERRKRAWLTA